jgi:hypothetical protein
MTLAGLDAKRAGTHVSHACRQLSRPVTARCCPTTGAGIALIVTSDRRLGRYGGLHIGRRPCAARISQPDGTARLPSNIRDAGAATGHRRTQRRGLPVRVPNRIRRARLCAVSLIVILTRGLRQLALEAHATRRNPEPLVAWRVDANRAGGCVCHASAFFLGVRRRAAMRRGCGVAVIVPRAPPPSVCWRTYRAADHARSSHPAAVAAD